MSKNEEVLESLKLYIRNAQGSEFNSVVQLPIETALRIQSLLQKHHSALKSAAALVDALNNNYDKNNSYVLIDKDIIKINEVIIKSALA